MVNVISDTVQEFNGERFYLCGRYFQHKGKRLHRAVWEWYNGEVPEGYHIHHLDEDRSNNNIENLALLPGVDHIKQHMNTPVAKERSSHAVLLAVAAAPDWHKSEEGRAWHSERARETWAETLPHACTCDLCGKEYMTREARKVGHHFCSNNCKSEFRRRSGVDDELRVCPVCGREYVVNRYSRSKTCSRECGKILRWGK